jgi:PadR family transcriptional regulator, regulatory protein PadR
MTSAAYLVLAALQDGALHGYAIRQRVIEFDTAAKPTPVATLYATIERLEKDGLVELVAEEVVEGRTRRTYQLAKVGKSALLKESARLANAAALVRQPNRVARSAKSARS